MSIEILDGGGPGSTSFDQLIDGGLPATDTFTSVADAGGAIRGEVTVAQGAQTTNGIQSGIGTVTTSQGEHVAATGTVTISGTATTRQAQTTHATGTVTITGSVTTAQGSETVRATNVVISATVTTAQGGETVRALGTVTPFVPPTPPPTPNQYPGGMGGGGGVAGGYVISLAGFRRKTIEITVCIPGELPCTVEVATQDEIPVCVRVSGIQQSAKTVQVSAKNLINVLAKRPAYNLTEIINTTESTAGAKVLFNQPRAQIHDITTINT